MSDNLTDLIQEALDARIEEIKFSNSFKYTGSVQHEYAVLNWSQASKNLEDKINEIIDSRIKSFMEKKV